MSDLSISLNEIESKLQNYISNNKQEIKSFETVFSSLQNTYKTMQNLEQNFKNYTC